MKALFVFVRSYAVHGLSFLSDNFDRMANLRACDGFYFRCRSNFFAGVLALISLFSAALI